MVIDKFPFLAKATPALPSLIQRALEPAAQRRNTPVRLLLCGSALSFMGKLLAGSAPLRGRAGLELLVPTLDFRLAREFWGIGDLRTAVLTNAVVGGTPAYRREFAQDDIPAGPDDFDPWVCRTVLNPGRPLFREARYILAEEPDIHDTALYHAVLAAIAEGNTTRGGIAGYLERKSTDLAHPLGVLHDAGLITHETEAFKKNRSAYRIAEPLLTFYHAIMRPAWGDLERPGRAPQVWRRSQHAFHSNVVGPHFEEICRQWTRWHAGPETYGGGLQPLAGPASRWAGAITRASEDQWQLATGTCTRSKPACGRGLAASRRGPRSRRAGRTAGSAGTRPPLSGTPRPSASRHSGPAVEGGAAAGQRCRAYRARREEPAAQAPEPRRGRPDRGPVASAVGGRAAVPDRRRRGRQALG